MDKRLDMKKVQDVMERLIFDMLLVTDGRTTDLLEAILNEKMLVSVIRQQKLVDESSYLRESILISDKSRFIVSHNIALVYSQYVPPALFEKIANREEGIGSSIRSIGIESYRLVVDSGQKKGDEAVDLFQKPLMLRFPDLKRPVPYKNYVMQFGHVPGIQMLEYFNPEMVNHRLMRIYKQQNGGMTNE
jgi:adenylosuccinate synthase